MIRAIEEVTGPRGGKIFVITLECGHWRTERSAPRNLERPVSCIACYVEAARRAHNRDRL